jgi:hypothetical protein
LEREQKEQGKDLATVYSFIKKFLEEPIKKTDKIGFNS